MIAPRAAWVLLALLGLACGSTRPASAPAPASERLGARCAAGTQHLLSPLAARLSVELVVSRGEPALGAIEREFARLAAVYSRLGVRARVVQPASGEPLPAAARELEPQRLVLGDGRQVLLFAGAVLRLGDRQKVIAAFDPGHPEAIAYELALRVRELELAERRQVIRVGVLTGKRELGLHEPLLAESDSGQPSPVSIMEAAFSHYRLPRVGVDRLRQSSLRALIVTQPGSAYTPAELAELDRFVIAGDRTLVFLLSATRLERPGRASPPLARSTSLGELDRLLAGYDIELGRDLVIDPGAAFELDVHVHDQMAAVNHPALLQLDVGGPLAGFGSIELVLPFSSSVELARKRQPADVELSLLARATESAERSLASPGRPAPAPRAGVIALAQGRLRSAFGDARAASPSRVLVVGSAFAFSNPFLFSSAAADVSPELGHALADAYARTELTTSLVALKNLLDWMTLDPDLAACAREPRPS